MPSTTRLSLQLLLHTKIGIDKIVAFLATTGIATRKWHLERNREEVEDEEAEEERRRRRDSSTSRPSTS